MEEKNEEKNINSEQSEGKRYRHISEKRSSFSVRKFSRMLLFIIILVIVGIGSSKFTTFRMNKRDEKIIRKMFAKVEEDKSITNFYEKKRWDVDVVRETWRKGDNYVIKDTYDDGTADCSLYIDGVYYIIRDVRDDVNGVTTKRVTKMINMGKNLPNPGLQLSTTVEVNDDLVKEWAQESTIKSTKMEGIDCYQIYVKKANETYFMDKSTNRIIREIKLYKEDDDDEVKSIDTGIIEITTNCVTDQDVSLPDISGYEIVEYDVNEEMKKQYNITDSVSDEEEPDLLEDEEQQ